MLPKTHFILSLLFSLILLLIFPRISYYFIVIVLAAVLIDVDHYMAYVYIKRDFSLKKAFQYFVFLKNNIKKEFKRHMLNPGPLVFLHTIEFMLILLLLSFLHKIFFFILIGFLFHSILDLIDIYITYKSLKTNNLTLLFFLINEKYLLIARVNNKPLLIKH